MKTKASTGEAIAALINSQGGDALSARERHIYREALHALVRLAKSELMLEIKSNVTKLTASAPLHPRKKRIDANRQRQFEFHQDR
jgi:hypothetical protein